MVAEGLPGSALPEPRVMDRRWLLVLAAGWIGTAGGARADPLEPEYREVVRKGLDWLVEHQEADGRWSMANGGYPVSATSLAGTALLMEGSTLREGRYAPAIRKTVDWLLNRVQANGLIGNAADPRESSHYMYGHGFAMLFLASVYGEEEDENRRKQLEQVLTKAVEYTGRAQTSRGGWGYTSARDLNDFDEGSVTITQLQGLRACRNAGIPVNKKIIDHSIDYLKKATRPSGVVIYSLANGNGQECPAITVAAVSCGFNAGEYDSELAKRWLRYVAANMPIDRMVKVQTVGQWGFFEYTHLYYAQSLYVLGDDRFRALFPDLPEKDHLTWSKYRKPMFDLLKSLQTRDGSWGGTQNWFSQGGPVFATACFATIMQLDHDTLPIFHR
jgi:hypothetical protein